MYKCTIVRISFCRTCDGNNSVARAGGVRALLGDLNVCPGKLLDLNDGPAARPDHSPNQRLVHLEGFTVTICLKTFNAQLINISKQTLDMLNPWLYINS